MGNELSVHVQIVLARRDAESRNIDGYMQDPKKRQCEHRWNRVRESAPMDSLEVVKGIKVVPGMACRRGIENPASRMESLHGNVQREFEEVKDGSHLEEVATNQQV